MKIPNGMPTLSWGAHAPTEGKACVMEYVSLLAGEQWSDHPECTHPALAAFARHLNDRLEDEHRHVLVPLIGRLLGTDEHSITISTAIANAQVMHPRYGDYMATVKVLAEGKCSCGADHGDSYTNEYKMKSEEASVVGVEILTAMIDAYDKATGRTEHHIVTDQEYADLALAVG